MSTYLESNSGARGTGLLLSPVYLVRAPLMRCGACCRAVKDPVYSFYKAYPVSSVCVEAVSPVWMSPSRILAPRSMSSEPVERFPGLWICVACVWCVCV